MYITNTTLFMIQILVNNSLNLSIIYITITFTYCIIDQYTRIYIMATKIQEK